MEFLENKAEDITVGANLLYFIEIVNKLGLVLC